MQCPPTNSGVCLWKFHLVEAAERTSSTSSPSLEEVWQVHLQMLSISLCAFSTSFDASATSIELTGITPPDVIFSYNFERILVRFASSEPITLEHLLPHNLLSAYSFWAISHQYFFFRFWVFFN